MAHTRSTREERLAQVRAWLASGQSAKAFGARHGIPAATLCWWRWRLSRDGEDLRRRRARRGGSRRPRFVEITAPKPVVVSRDLALIAPAFAPAAIRIELGGASIVVERGFDADALRRVVDVLGSRS